MFVMVVHYNDRLILSLLRSSQMYLEVRLFKF